MSEGRPWSIQHERSAHSSSAALLELVETLPGIDQRGSTRGTHRPAAASARELLLSQSPPICLSSCSRQEATAAGRRRGGVMSSAVADAGRRSVPPCYSDSLPLRSVPGRAGKPALITAIGRVNLKSRPSPGDAPEPSFGASRGRTHRQSAWKRCRPAVAERGSAEAGDKDSASQHEKVMVFGRR
jgi:hypothetical protein